MHYKNDKKCEIRYHQMFFSKLKMHQNLLDPAGEAYDAPPEPPSRLGRGIPPLQSYPLVAFGVSNSAPRSSGPINTNSCFIHECCGLFCFLPVVYSYIFFLLFFKIRPSFSEIRRPMVTKFCTVNGSCCRFDPLTSDLSYPTP